RHARKEGRELSLGRDREAVGKAPLGETESLKETWRSRGRDVALLKTPIGILIGEAGRCLEIVAREIAGTEGQLIAVRIGAGDGDVPPAFQQVRAPDRIDGIGAGIAPI